MTASPDIAPEKGLGVAPSDDAAAPGGSAPSQSAPVSAVPAPPANAIYIQFSDDGVNIRKWSRDPFEGAREYRGLGLPDADGWISHDRGEMPVPGHVVVEIRAEDGYRDQAEAGRYGPEYPGDEDWWTGHPARKGDCIIAYRVVQQ